MLRLVFGLVIGCAYKVQEACKSPVERLECYSNNELFMDCVDDDKFVLIDRLETLISELSGEYLRYRISDRDFEAFCQPLLNAFKQSVHTGQSEGFIARPDPLKYTKGGYFIRIGDLKSIALERLESGQLPADGKVKTIPPAVYPMGGLYPDVVTDGLDLNLVRALGMALNLSVHMCEDDIMRLNGSRMYNNATRLAM